MAIDTDDIKILVHSSFQLLMKCCWQCLKDHPFFSVFLLVFLSFYIFAPSLFNLLFYTSTLVICTAILLQGQFQFRHQNITTDDENDKATMKRSPRESDGSSRKLRPTIQAAMSRRTFKKRTCEELGTILMEDLKVDFIIRSFSDDIPMKLREEKVSIGSDDSVSLSSGCKKNAEAEKPSDAVKIDAESQKDDKVEARLPQEKEKSKPVVEWTEEDQRNHMDLGSSDIERNKRLENLIAKRRARKVFSMQPYRNPLNAVASDFQGLVTPINTERNSSDSEGGQPGSAPSVLGPTNPFDLPYDPSEEKPVLTGDGFAEEILITQPKDMHYCRHESFTYGPSFFTDHYDDPHTASRFSVFTNPIASICPGLPRSRRHSDAGGSVKHVSEQSSHEGLSNEVQLENTQSNRPEEVNIPAQDLPASHEENVSPNCEYADTMLLESRDAEQEERQSNTLAMEATEMNQQDLIEDDNDETSSLSSFEATADVASASADVAVAVKNETFRNSVKKVLDVIQKNRDIPSPRFAHPTKMEERSFYTRPSHHLSYSIASDMQVEVSDEPNSPTDVESLVFHRDEDDTDESSQGTSRGSVELEESRTRSNAQLFVDYPTSGQADEENLNNSYDFNVESSHAEDHDMVQTTNMLPVDDQECVTRDIEFGSIQSPGDSATSPTTQFRQTLQQDNHHTIGVPMMMVGSASTSTEQNIDSYIHSPSNNDPQIQTQDPNVQHPISPSQTEDLDPISPSINIAESAPSPKSVLPETTPVHELASSWECGTSFSQDSGHAMVHTTTHDSDEMALMSSADVQPFDGPPVSTTSLHDLPLMEDEVCLGASTPLKKDSGEETSKLRD